MTSKIFSLPKAISNSLLLVWLLPLSFLFQQCGNTVHQTGEAQQTVTIFDGDKVYLNSYSRLEELPAEQESEKRIQFAGEGFFEVQFDPKRNFVIATDSIETITTNGGRFHVGVSEKMFDIAVQSGTVTVQAKKTTPTIELTAGMEANFDRKTSRKTVLPKGTMNADFWRSNVLEFYDTPLRLVFDDLKKIYGVIFTNTSRSLMDCTFTYRLENATLPLILETLTERFDITFNQQSNKTIILNGGSCLPKEN